MQRTNYVLYWDRRQNPVVLRVVPKGDFNTYSFFLRITSLHKPVGSRFYNINSINKDNMLCHSLYWGALKSPSLLYLGSRDTGLVDISFPVPYFHQFLLRVSESKLSIPPVTKINASLVQVRIIIIATRVIIAN